MLGVSPNVFLKYFGIPAISLSLLVAIPVHGSNEMTEDEGPSTPPASTIEEEESIVTEVPQEASLVSNAVVVFSPSLSLLIEIPVHGSEVDPNTPPAPDGPLLLDVADLTSMTLATDAAQTEEQAQPVSSLSNMSIEVIEEYLIPYLLDPQDIWSLALLDPSKSHLTNRFSAITTYHDTCLSAASNQRSYFNIFGQRTAEENQRKFEQGLRLLFSRHPRTSEEKEYYIKTCCFIRETTGIAARARLVEEEFPEIICAETDLPSVPFSHLTLLNLCSRAVSRM